MSNNRNSRQKSQFRKCLRQSGEAASESKQDTQLQFLLVTNSTRTKQAVVRIRFGKYTAAGIAHKEALVNGKCLRVHVKPIKERIIKKLHEKKLQVQLKKSSLNRGRKQLRLLGKLNSRIQSKSLQNKRKNGQTSFPNSTSKFIKPQHTTLRGRTQIPNRKFANFITIPIRKRKQPISMSTDSETEKCDPLNIPTKAEDETENAVAFDEVKSFLPVDEPACSESNEKESDADPLGYENDPLSDNELSQTIEENKPAFEKFNGQSTPLRTYAGKRPRKSPSVSETEDTTKKPRLEDTDSEDLETLLAGAPITEEETQNKNQIDNGDSTVELEEEKTSRSNTMNGNVIVDNGCIYTLVCRTGRPGRKRMLRNNIGFEKLVHQMKLIRLPGPNWKIRLFVTRDQQISEITFTNKMPNERCVKFSRSSITYVITFNSNVVTLVGAPTSIDSHTDITHLLEIVNSLDDDDPLIEYSTNTK